MEVSKYTMSSLVNLKENAKVMKMQFLILLGTTLKNQHFYLQVLIALSKSGNDFNIYL